ncbi:MAG: ABC transporter permease [Oscillospiraceae bacterium]|jgi:putative ABC transport system permease protein
MDSVIMALESIRDKKIRSFLTMLGIIIGVGAVLILVSVVKGFNADLTAYYEKQGVNKVNVSLTNYDRTNTIDQSGEFMEWVTNTLTEYITGVTPSYSASGTLKYYGNTNSTAKVYFGNEQWSACNNFTLDEGRDLLAMDIDNKNRVCVIGSYVADVLFGFRNPVGETIMYDGTPLTVVGIFYPKDGSAEESMDDMIVVPYTLNRQILGSDTVSQFTIKVALSTNMTAVISKVEDWMLENVDTDASEYSVENGNDAMQAVEDETASLQVVLGGVAGIALLVGGIGIMNIMLVTVTERTREIGIKKAIGAQRRVIISQFLVESTVLSGIGGIFGIFIGYAGSLILGKAIYDMILLPDAWMTVASFLFSLVIGIGFGMYPAVKASGLQPVDALRAD